MRIQHVSIPRPPGSDVQARAFYGDLLGLTEITPPASLPGVIWFELGDTELHLLEEAETDQSSERHFCIALADSTDLPLDSLRQRMIDAGHFDRDATPIPGRPRFFVTDPFGNSIELTTIQWDYRDISK